MLEVDRAIGARGAEGALGGPGDLEERRRLVPVATSDEVEPLTTFHARASMVVLAVYTRGTATLAGE